MNQETIYRKMMKAFALAGENPSTDEEITAYKIGNDLKRKLERKQHRTLLTYGGLVPYEEKKTKSKVTWKEWIKVEKDPIVTIQVIPDTSCRNYRTEEIGRLITQLFRLPIERIKREGAKIRYKLQEKVSFEIRIQKGEIAFFFYVPTSIESLVTKKLQSVWEKATIQTIKSEPLIFSEKASVQELVYRKHDLYSLNINSKDNAPLGSIFESSRLIGENDKASIYGHFEPIHQATIQAELTEVWRKLRDGTSPKKWDSSIKNILLLAGIGISAVLKEIVTTMSELFSNEKDAKENIYTKNYTADPMATQMAIEQLSSATKQKANKEIVRTHLWVAAEGSTEKESQVISKTIANSFGDISGDNDLVAKELYGNKKKEVIYSINHKTGPRINIRSNYMSINEVGKLIQVPGLELIEKYKDIVAIKQREIEIDKALTKGGVKLGQITWRGQQQNVYLPTKNYNELCLPRAIVGGMGQGKSYSVANFGIEYNRNGFGCIIVDPAKGEIGDIIEKVLPPENIVRINLAKVPMSLDWNEIAHLPRSRNRLAQAVISFFNSQTDEAGAQTARYLKSMVYAMQKGSLKELLDILEDASYRKHLISYMPDNLHRITLEEFDNLSDGKRTQIKMPIYNRLDVILGDEFLVECMDSEYSLNMVELMEDNKCVIIDVPKRELGEEGVDLIINILSSKIHLAMAARDQDKAHPFFIIFDELHQMQRSKDIWKSAAVESRKWRIGYTWIFHSFEQVEKGLRKIIQDAGPNYTLFRSSKGTFKELEKEIAPFTIEEGIKLERYHAINIINADNRVIEPFVCKMNDPL